MDVAGPPSIETRAMPQTLHLRPSQTTLEPENVLSGELFGTVNNSNTVLNNNDRIAFACTLTGGSVTTANDSSVWFGSAGNLQMIAREGGAVHVYAARQVPSNDGQYARFTAPRWARKQNGAAGPEPDFCVAHDCFWAWVQ